MFWRPKPMLRLATCAKSCDTFAIPRSGLLIAVDGAIVEDGNFRNLLLDVALLRSLRIGVALVHGADTGSAWRAAGPHSLQHRRTGVTDSATLQLALNAANRVSHEILRGSAPTTCAGRGATRGGSSAGICKGSIYQVHRPARTGDIGLLRALMEHDVIPVFRPWAVDGEGNTYRLIRTRRCRGRRALQAVKLIYLTTAAASSCNRRANRAGPLLRQLTSRRRRTSCARARAS